MDENFDAGIKAELDGIMKNVDNVLKKLEEAGYGVKGCPGNEPCDPSDRAETAP